MGHLLLAIGRILVCGLLGGMAGLVIVEGLFALADRIGMRGMF